MTLLNRFLKAQYGVTAIEYGLIASGIALAIAVIVPSVGAALAGIFSSVGSLLTN
jgi:pilus assembly protein Flp/PilA